MIFFEASIDWQKATARRIGSGSFSLKMPASPKIFFDSALIQPINFEASSVLISLFGSAIAACTDFGTSASFIVSTITL